MTAWPAQRRQGLVAAALARAESWLLEPAHGAAPTEPVPPPPAPPRPVVAVIGLARRCGATTLARAVAVELALRDPGGTAAVLSERVPGAPLALATPASARLARHLRALGCKGARAVGRLCLVGDGAVLGPKLVAERPAPLVIDGGRDGTAAAFADRVVVVGDQDVEPALAVVVSASLERAGRRPALVANRVEDPGRWLEVGALTTSGSQLSAGLALAGREPRGRLGAVLRELVDGWEREGW